MTNLQLKPVLFPKCAEIRGITGNLEKKYPHYCCIHARQVFFRVKCYHALCVDVFVEDEHSCKVVRAVHVSDMRHSNGVSKPPRDFWNRKWSKNNLGLPWRQGLGTDSSPFILSLFCRHYNIYFRLFFAYIIIFIFVSIFQFQISTFLPQEGPWIRMTAHKACVMVE